MRLKALAESTQCIPLHSSVISLLCQNFAKMFAEFSKISKIPGNLRKFWQNSSKFLKKCDFRAVQRSALCRSRRELSNAYLLAKFGFDTAENEPCKVCPLGRRTGAQRSQRPRGARSPRVLFFVRGEAVYNFQQHQPTDAYVSIRKEHTQTRQRIDDTHTHTHTHTKPQTRKQTHKSAKAF